jgi:hypothetical protein
MRQASQFYSVGGTLPSDAPSYVERAADKELLEHVRESRFCYILTTRQIGKSSLMVRTAERLVAEGTRAAIVDLTGIGSDQHSVTTDQWYYGIATTILNQLDLDEDLDAWWDRQGKLTPLQRFVRFLREVVLSQTSEPVVIFVDEIDSTLDLSFSSDFFAAIRACYNGRARDSELGRLTFVLVGAAEPTDLIADPRRTPFNIGTRIELPDFRRDEAELLAKGLSDGSAGREQALDRVFFWTDGHPYAPAQALSADPPGRNRQGRTRLGHPQRAEALRPGEGPRRQIGGPQSNLRQSLRRILDQGSLAASQ